MLHRWFLLFSLILHDFPFQSIGQTCVYCFVCVFCFFNRRASFSECIFKLSHDKIVLFEQNVNISKCFRGCHAPSIVIYNRKRLSATRRGWRTFQGQFFRHPTTVRVVIVRTFSRNRIVRVVIVRYCPTKDRFPAIGEPLTSIVVVAVVVVVVSSKK